MKAKLLLLLTLMVLPALSAAQTVDKDKVAQFATAVSHAEGYGVRHAIPTRYHNPGDLKTIPSAAKLPGQKAIGKGGHVVFRTDAAGWAALQDQVAKMVDGRSKHFNPDMTLTQVARKYAGNWRPWLKTVAREMNAAPTTKLRELLYVSEPEVPQMVAVEIHLPVMLTQAREVMPVLMEPGTPGFCNDVVQQNCRSNEFQYVDFQY